MLSTAISDLGLCQKAEASRLRLLQAKISHSQETAQSTDWVDSASLDIYKLSIVNCLLYWLRVMGEFPSPQSLPCIGNTKTFCSPSHVLPIPRWPVVGTGRKAPSQSCDEKRYTFYQAQCKTSGLATYPGTQGRLKGR